MIGLGFFSTCVLLITLSAPTYTEGSGIVILGYGNRRSNQPTQVTPEEALAGRSIFGNIDSGLDENGPPSGEGNKPAPGPPPAGGAGEKPEAPPPQSSPPAPTSGGATSAGPRVPAQPNEGAEVGAPGMGPAASGLGGDFMGPSPFNIGGPGANVFAGYDFNGFRGRAPPGARSPGAGSGGVNAAAAGVQPGPMPPRGAGTGGPSGVSPSIRGPGPSEGGGVGEAGEEPVPAGGSGAGEGLPLPEGPASGSAPLGSPTEAGGRAGLSGGNLGGREEPGSWAQPTAPSSGSGVGLAGGPPPGLNGGGEPGRPGGPTSVGGGAGSGNQPDLFSDPDFKEFEREMHDHIRESEGGFVRHEGPGENGGSILRGMAGTLGAEAGITGGISGGASSGGPEGLGGGTSEISGGGGWGGFSFGGQGGGPIPTGFGGFSTAGGELSGEFGGGPSGGITALEGHLEESGAAGGPGGPVRAPQPSAAGPIRGGGRQPSRPLRRRPSTSSGNTDRPPQGTRRRGMRVLTLNRRLVRRILQEEGFDNKDIAYLLNSRLLLSARGKGLAVVLARLANIKRGSPFYRTRRRLATRFIRRFLKTYRDVRRVVLSVRNRFRRSPSSVTPSLGSL